jgi:hypothetical protein
VDAFVRDVVANDHVGAIERWYAEDAWMQENQAPPRVGRATLMEGEAKTLSRVAGVETALVDGPLIAGETVAIRWRFTFTGKDGARRILEEVAWQTWENGKIRRETFFYDPAQMAG